MHIKVRFKGEEYIIVGNMTKGGAIATEDQYRHGRCSYAHLFDDGRIIRFGKQIGTREDLEVIGESDVQPTLKAMSYVILGDWAPEDES